MFWRSQCILVCGNGAHIYSELCIIFMYSFHVKEIFSFLSNEWCTYFFDLHVLANVRYTFYNPMHIFLDYFKIVENNKRASRIKSSSSWVLVLSNLFGLYFFISSSWSKGFQLFRILRYSYPQIRYHVLVLFCKYLRWVHMGGINWYL